MRLRGAKQVHYDSGPNMTPLVDVVMVILIFLMLAGSFGTAEHYLVSSSQIHASGGAGAPPPPGWVPPTQLDIRVDTNGIATLSGVTSGFVDPELLRQELERRLGQFKAEGKNIKEVEVVLRPSEGTRWDSLIPFYDAALRAKFEKVAFATAGSK